MVDRDAQIVGDGLDEVVRPLGPVVEGRIDLLVWPDRAAGWHRDEQVPRDGQDRCRVGGGVDVQHHDHVAQGPAVLGGRAELLDLLLVGQSGPGFIADEQDVFWQQAIRGVFAGGQLRRGQVGGGDRLDLVQAPAGVGVGAADDDQAQRGDDVGRDQDTAGASAPPECVFASAPAESAARPVPSTSD